MSQPVALRNGTVPGSSRWTRAPRERKSRPAPAGLIVSSELMDFAMLSCPKGAWRSRNAAGKATGPAPGPTMALWYAFPVVAEPFEAHSSGRRYLRAPVRIDFPVEELAPETGVHLELRTALFLVLRGELSRRAFVGSEQFLYWDP